MSLKWCDIEQNLEQSVGINLLIPHRLVPFDDIT